MLRIKTILMALASVTLFAGIYAPAVNAEPEESSTWPVETDLMIKDWTANESDVFLNIGKVYFVNSRDELKIIVEPDDPFMIKEAHVHVQLSDDFEDVLDKKGQPKLSKFDFRTDYLGDMQIRSPRHEQVITFEFLEDKYDPQKVCWGLNEMKCPPFYAIAAVTLQILDEEGEWVDVPENAYATNDGQFDRYDKNLSQVWGHYVTYPKAKPLAGHFIDANVNGLSYATATQSGITTSTGETGEDGQFWFVKGERIGFSVGKLFLGETLADRRLSPVELFPGAMMEDPRVVNVARLLQTLDADGVVGRGAINITEPVVACLETAMMSLGLPFEIEPNVLFAEETDVTHLTTDLIDATVAACAPEIALTAVTGPEALENLNFGMQASNLMKRNISKDPDLLNDKAKIEIMPVYVPAQWSDGTQTSVAYYDEDGNVVEERDIAKPIMVTYLGEEEGTGVSDVYVAISRDDGDSWKRRNISRTAGKSSLATLGPNGYLSDYPGGTAKPMLKVKDNMIFVAWTGKYCKGGRPGYAINVCETFDVDSDGDDVPDTCLITRETDQGTVTLNDYTGDDGYWQDDLYGVAGPQRSVDYEGEDGMGEVPYSCVWTARATIDAETGDIQWFKPERVTSGRRDAYQLFAGAGEDVAFGIVWQEDPRGLMPGEGDGPGDGWSGANTHSKTDIWYSYITMKDFAKVDWDYPVGGHGDNEDLVDQDPELAGRVKAMVPMSLPVRISDNDVCSLENILALGGEGDHEDGEEHDFDHDGQGTHRYCGTVDEEGNLIPSPLCASTLPKENPQGVVHNVCVTEDGRYLDGNTGASRPNLFLQPFKNPVTGKKSALAIIGYEESKGVGTPPEEEEGCGDEDVALAVTEGEEDDHEDRYKPDSGKNVIYHSFWFDQPEAVSSGGILNLPERDAAGNLVYLTEDPALYEPDPPPLMLDWKDEPILAYENARRIRFVLQSPSKRGDSGTILVALYRQGEEGGGKPADIFMRTLKFSTSNPAKNPFDFTNFRAGAKNLSSVEPDPDYLWQNPLDEDAPIKMLRWSWSLANLDDSSARNPYTDSRAHRGALNGDDLIIGYTWTPNWGRKANDKYDFYVRRSFDAGGSWTTDPMGGDIEHNVVFRDPVLDEYDIPILDENDHVQWVEEVVTIPLEAGYSEPPRNVSNLRNYRTSVMEPRLVKTPGSILTDDDIMYPEDEQDTSVYQVAFGTEFNQNASPNDVTYPKMPLDIMYGRTRDKGQHFESVIVTAQGGSGKPEEGMNPLAQDHPEQGAVQLRQTPDGSRMYGIWLEHGQDGTDIMFRRVDYRGADE